MELETSFLWFSLIATAEFHFENLIFRRLHTQTQVRVPRARIIGMHVEPQAAYVLTSPSDITEVLEKSAKDSHLSQFFSDVNALQPPEIAIAPITPFVSDHHLTSDDSIHLGNIIDSLGGVFQDSRYSNSDAIRVEAQLFRLFGQSQIEFGDYSGIGNIGLSNSDIDTVC